MILRDSAYSAVFSCFKSISSSKSIKNFSPWVPRSEKLHFFQGTIFKVTEKITPPKMVAELVSLLPGNLEIRDRNAGEATSNMLFFPFLFSFFPLHFDLFEHRVIDLEHQGSIQVIKTSAKTERLEKSDCLFIQ